MIQREAFVRGSEDPVVLEKEKSREEVLMEEGGKE
jgi:hypothetical protein